MEAAYIEAYCPFELKDKVMYIGTDSDFFNNGEVYIVKDILAIYSLSAGSTIFNLVVGDIYGNLHKPRRCELFRLVK